MNLDFGALALIAIVAIGSVATMGAAHDSAAVEPINDSVVVENLTTNTTYSVGAQELTDYSASIENHTLEESTDYSADETAGQFVFHDTEDVDDGDDAWIEFEGERTVSLAETFTGPIGSGIVLLGAATLILGAFGLLAATHRLSRRDRP